MENDKYLKLTNTVYKVLEFFPESDPLKNRAKDKALVIMDSLILVNENGGMPAEAGWTSFRDVINIQKTKAQILEDIDIFLGYLWIGKSQGWLNSVNYLIIANQYEKIKSAVSPIMADEPRPEGRENKPEVEPKEDDNPVLDDIAVIKDDPDYSGISERQKKIMGFLEKNQKAQVMDLQTILPDITKRTIRRDIDDLLEAGKIIRMGDFNQVFYQIK